MWILYHFLAHQSSLKQVANVLRVSWITYGSQKTGCWDHGKKIYLGLGTTTFKATQFTLEFEISGAVWIWKKKCFTFQEDCPSIRPWCCWYCWWFRNPEPPRDGAKTLVNNGMFTTNLNLVSRSSVSSSPKPGGRWSPGILKDFKGFLKPNLSSSGCPPRKRCILMVQWWDEVSSSKKNVCSNFVEGFF